MRSYIIPLIVSFAALASCSRQAPEPKYDINCPVRSVMVHASKGELDHLVTFDRDGHATAAEYYNEDGTFRYRNEYSYDAAGRVEEILLVNAAGESEERWEFKYDGEFVADCTISGMNNEHVHRWLHTNDGTNIVRTVYCQEDVPTYIITREYEGEICHETTCDAETGDTVGTALCSQFTKDKVLYIKSETTDLSVEYDEKGLPVKARNTSLDSECQILWEPSLMDEPERFFSYEFDARGNWTVRKEYSHPDSVEVAVISREIKY